MEVKAGLSVQNTTESCKPNEVLTDSTNITCPRKPEPIELDNPLILENLGHVEHSQPQLTVMKKCTPILLIILFFKPSCKVVNCNKLFTKFLIIFHSFLKQFR